MVFFLHEKMYNIYNSGFGYFGGFSRIYVLIIAFRSCCFLTFGVHAREGYSSAFVCLSAFNFMKAEN